jgi:hypothetical protein
MVGQSLLDPMTMAISGDAFITVFSCLVGNQSMVVNADAGRPISPGGLRLRVL